MAEKTPGSGRRAGTPNKATAKLKVFLDAVFDDVFKDEAYRTRLVTSIKDGSIDGRLFATLLQHYAGRPGLAVDHTHSGIVSLAQIIAGRVPTDDEDADDDT